MRRSVRRAFRSFLPLLISSRPTPSSSFQTTFTRLSLLRPSSSTSTFQPLAAGREPRTKSTSTTTTEEQLISKEEQARILRTGQAKHRFEKAVRREDRITHLEGALATLSNAEQSELEGLRQVRDTFEEQYNPESFSEDHVEFKKLHNQAFVALTQYCQDQRQVNDDTTTEPVNVFFLDGPDGCTASALIDSGLLNPSQCYVANRHLSTCQALRTSGGGLLPEENVLYATAAEALTPSEEDDSPSFSDIPFSAYYFDGCGGFVPHIIDMMTSALLLRDDPKPPLAATTTIAVGFSLMGGNKNVIEKELEACRALAVIARTRGMRTLHVLDDPEKYGIPPDIPKTGGGTFTTWILLEPDN
ncbi:expressed unknown protein [Seminavis robusta]|uniref:Uncharacterized protein n=1 Tax=Seminavis robusta TaxID=568900 RepID=A0A9N8HMR2_9STRA|nr:expressed unknown protein [Seminavis robusta]|eukprot:Sro765_g199230.1 n/a (359) ;mRNA; f:35501-36577